MGYRRSFQKTIRVDYDYPATEHGGSGSTYETIYVDVYVDTDPFDSSIEDMKREVDTLTGSVIATEGAQVASIHENSRKIGNTIISGFFKTVRSDISQQIAELKIKSEALLVQLNELAKRTHDKKRQMEVDYQRISSRYAKIFEELNHELENRIHSIDEPVFTFTRKTDEIGSTSQKMVAVPSVTAGENARLHSMITSALAKRQALETISKAHRFLEAQYKTDRHIKHCLMPGGENSGIVAPYCFMESVSSPGVVDAKIYPSIPLKNVDSSSLLKLSKNVDTSRDNSKETMERIEPFFNSEVATIFTSDNEQHDQRVATLTKQLFNNFITHK